MSQCYNMSKQRLRNSIGQTQELGTRRNAIKAYTQVAARNAALL
jgi:hypothetical protein